MCRQRSIPAAAPADVRIWPLSTNSTFGSTVTFGWSSASSRAARQCVVARMPSSSPAAASTNDPVHGLTLLDLIGPQTTLGMHGVTHLIAERLDPVLSDSGIAILPTTTYENCPRDLDVLFVPGGMGTADAMEDAKLLEFLRDRAETARYVTSVCSGSLILAAAGLLKGYRATTHWTSLDVLDAFGVSVEPLRVVSDRNRITGGGVTAGIET